MAGGDILLYVFIGCLAFGTFYSIVSLVLGGHGFDHGVDHGFDYSIDHGGDVDVNHGSDAAAGPSPFNPLVIASAITAFGAVGLAAMKGFGMSGLLSTIVALAFAGVIGAAIFFGIVKFMYGSQSNSDFTLSELMDTEAEILTPIPENGLGEIAYVANGIRYTLSARSLEGESIKRGTVVVIRDIRGSVAIVQQKLTLEDIEIYQEEYEKGKDEKPRSDAGNK